MKNIALMLVLFGAVGSASAVELVTNGNFETQDSGGFYGEGWDIDANFAYPDRSVFFEDWSTIYDPNGGNLSGASAFLTAADEDDVTISQMIDTTDFTDATLKFDLVSDGYDFPGFDFVEVSFGGTLLDTIDVGSDDGEYFSIAASYDLTPLFTGGMKELEIRGILDDSLETFTFVDNVSITATASAVPEPATMAALSFGALALMRRRKKA